MKENENTMAETELSPDVAPVSNRLGRLTLIASESVVDDDFSFLAATITVWERKEAGRESEVEGAASQRTSSAP